MQLLRSREVVAGIVCIALGAVVVWITSDYRFGTPRRMGPGFFPVTLGVILAGLGVLILISGLRDRTPLPRMYVRPLIILPATILAFALLLPRVGYGPAAAVVVLAAGFAGRAATPLGLGLLAAGLVPATWFLFAQALGVRLPFLAWNF
ncbi:MAG: tripartite tricarboxylate transporter TctB family protein [Alkalilacustris sp.]